jgi:hypothetical protein
MVHFRMLDEEVWMNQPPRLNIGASVGVASEARAAPGVGCFLLLPINAPWRKQSCSRTDQTGHVSGMAVEWRYDQSSYYERPCCYASGDKIFYPTFA